MGKYLDPKSDVVFKKIFGQHQHLLKSFLNAILPLSDDQFIVDLEYLPVEQIPAIPVFKKNIADVKCKDALGRVFIVEMQIEWTEAFMQRLLFGAAQAYVKQIKTGEQYHLLNPVYGLALVDTVFDKKTPEWYHHYGLVKLQDTKEELINGLTLVFVELPKFKVNTKEDRELKILWLRFMREITDETYEVDPALTNVPEIKEALSLAEEASYSPAELNAYEDYWKAVSSERTYGEGKFREGRKEGKEEGRREGKEEGRKEGKEEGRREGKEEGRREGKEEGKEEGRREGKEEGRKEGKEESRKEMVINFIKAGTPKKFIAQATGLSLLEINQIEDSLL